MILDMLPTGWDRIFCHPSKLRLLYKILTGNMTGKDLSVDGRSVTLVVDSTVPVNGLLIGTESRVIPLFGSIEIISHLRDRIRGSNKGEHHDSYTTGNSLQR
jgi:hypothetical protein